MFLNGKSLSGLNAAKVVQLTGGSHELKISRDSNSGNNGTTEIISFDNIADWKQVTDVPSDPGYSTYTSTTATGEMAILHIQNT